VVVALEVQMKQVVYVAGVLIILASISTPLFAGIGAVPEIDGGSFSAGIGLLAGGVLLLRAHLSGRK